MKKLLSIALVLVLVLSLGATAFAEGETYADAETATITKIYKAANGGVSPEETFSFTTLVCDSVTDAAEGVTKDNAPVPTIGTAEFAEGAATADGAEVDVTITLPTYTSVGIYTYKFTEAVPETKTAGVTYNDTQLYLVVTVIEQGGKVRVAAVHCEGSHEANAQSKTDEFTNTYESGTLSVSKSVTGNLGDKTKYFKVTVTFAAAEGETIASTIKYSGGSDAYAVAETSPATVSNNTVELYLKDGDTFTFTNIPKGATYTVVEDDYSGDGYTTSGEVEEATAMTAGGTPAVTITNNKVAEVDTGIVLDSLPYILLVAVVLSAAAVMFVNKRRSEV